MQRKGLFEWKILAAIFAVLIVLSSAFVANTGVKDFFLNLTGGLGNLLKGSPFGNIFSAPPKTVSYVEIRLFPDNITLVMETPVNITSGSSVIANFVGTVNFNLGEKSMQLAPAGSGVRILTEIRDAYIQEARIPRLLIGSIDFSVTSEETNITGSMESIEIYDFSGEIRASDHLILAGNVSKVKDGRWSIG